MLFYSPMGDQILEVVSWFIGVIRFFMIFYTHLGSSDCASCHGSLE